MDGAQICWIAPTLPMSLLPWEFFCRVLANVATDVSQRDRRIQVFGGGSLWVKSGDKPHMLRGPGWDGVIGDEFAFAKQEAWTVLRPAMTERKGWSFLITTPNGLNFYKEIVDQFALRKDGMTWQRPSSENPLVPPEELEIARLDLGPRLYAQEHEAQFMQIELSEFSGEYFSGDDIWFDHWPKLQAKVLALDPSKGKSDKSDYSAFIALGLGLDGRIYIDADIQRRDVRTIGKAAARLAAWWQPAGFFIESNQFQELLEPEIRRGAMEIGYSDKLPLYLIENQQNKIIRIRSELTPYLSRRLLRFRRRSPGVRLLMNQLLEFPQGDYDDGPDALALGLKGLTYLLGNDEERSDPTEPIEQWSEIA